MRRDAVATTWTTPGPERSLLYPCLWPPTRPDPRCRYKLVAAISARKPFDKAAFEARCSAYLHDAVALQARDVVREPTSAGMAYLKKHLAPLDSVWNEELPAELVLKDCATVVEALLAKLDADATLDARLTYLFNDVVDCGQVISKANGTSVVQLSLDVLVDGFKDARWTRFTVLRLEALWAMRETTGVMQALCDKVLAAEPFGGMLRALQDMKGTSEQPSLRRDDVGGLINGLAPNATDAYRDRRGKLICPANR